MLIITDDPFALVRYHIKKNNEEGRLIRIRRSSNLEEVNEMLLTGVDYDEDGELCPTTYLIKYEGKDILSKTFKQDTNNKTYLVVEDVHKYKRHFKDGVVNYLYLSPSQYQHEIIGLAAIMEPDTWPYFWSEYCINKFKSDPIKWYNEGKYLLFLYKERGNKKFNREDLDFLYHKVTDTAKEYLRSMYSDNAKDYILRMTPNELFITFIKGPKYKSPVQKSLEQYKPDMLTTYMYMKEAFFAGKIRLTEAVVLFDYLLNKKTINTTQRIRNLFNIT